MENEINEHDAAVLAKFKGQFDTAKSFLDNLPLDEKGRSVLSEEKQKEFTDLLDSFGGTFIEV